MSYKWLSLDVLCSVAVTRLEAGPASPKLVVLRLSLTGPILRKVAAPVLIDSSRD